ncbi:hypothetical protein CCB80_10190 [Armatimonadetes bacterium Uphvl-Ar1]|nr:hypothetical protein CCB80_10190 [Armatimonadetes bacterium Uphvl-Ar1]
MQRIRIGKDDVDRYLEDWGAVVAFRRDGGVGYPVSDFRSGGTARNGSGLPQSAERYLHIERLLDSETPLVRKVADGLFVRGILTVEEYARQVCGKDKAWAMGLAWLAGEMWRDFRGKVRVSLAEDVDWSVMDRARSAVAKPVALELPGYGQMTEVDRRAAMAAGWRP